MLRIAVLVSGGGTNLQAIMDAVADGKITNTEIATVISNNKNAYALERAAKAGIPNCCISPKDYADRAQFHEALLAALDEAQVDLIVLAGFLVVIPEMMIRKYRNRIINIHPSLIPKYCGDGFYGMRVHRAVVENGEKESGCTVHYVDEGTDTGEIIAQARVKLDADDTAESVAAKVLEKEHELLPRVVAALCKNQ